MEHEIDVESVSGTTGISGKKYAIGPGGTADRNRAGIGISVGTNGISVYEHSVNHLPAVLIYKTSIKDEMHVAVVYRQKTPYLYINGIFVKKGQQSAKQFVHPSILIGGMHPYGYFCGEMRDIRIWNYARTEEQMRNDINKRFTGTENGLYFYYEHPKEALALKFKKTDVDASIIIPSYNKYPENTFTLRSLANQTFNLSKVEVIFIDDGSTDNTFMKIHPMNYPFMMKLIRLNQNCGRPKSRNVALRYATGHLIIFIDAETIVAKNFIEEHIKEHLKNPEIVINGVINQKGVYTVFDPAFSETQKNQCMKLLKQANYPLKTIQEIQKAKEKISIISFKDIDNDAYKHLSFQKPHESIYKNQILKQFGNEFKNFHLPWLMFFTGNVSVPRHLLEKAGNFEENQFSGYGWEDTEMGYRLHRIGAHFIHHEKLITFHQEHPTHPTKLIEAKKNANVFFNMYQSDFSALSLILFMSNQINSFVKLNEFISEIKQLNTEFPHAFNAFKLGFKQLLLTLGKLNAENMPFKNLRTLAKLNNQFQQELILLKHKNKFPILIETCQRLLQL